MRIALDKDDPYGFQTDKSRQNESTGKKSLRSISMYFSFFFIFLLIHQALTLNSNSRRITTTGETVNLMAVDAQRVMRLVETLNQLWSAPFQICVAIYFLYVTMGVAVMAGLGTLLLLVPLNLLITRLVRKMQVT